MADPEEIAGGVGSSHQGDPGVVHGAAGTSGDPAPSTPTHPGLSGEHQDVHYDGVGRAAVWSYLAGDQQGQAWALLDNLSGDDLRDAARVAIELLSEANLLLAVATLALDDMTPRSDRFKARSLYQERSKPFMDRLAQRLLASASGRGSS